MTIVVNTIAPSVIQTMILNHFRFTATFTLSRGLYDSHCIKIQGLGERR